MKRSEAVKVIARALALPTISSTPSVYWMKYAEIAINTMEQCGMLPPDYESENQDGTQSHTYKNKWEPEEE
jgi:hypothetical protein